MNPLQKQQQKRSQARLKALSKLCRKVEVLCLPLQGVILSALNDAEVHEVLECVEQFEGKLAAVNAALHQLHERSLFRGGGASRRYAKKRVEQIRTTSKVAAPQTAADGTPRILATSLQGTCPEFPLVPVFQFIASHRKSGHLQIKLAEEIITIGILSGRVVHTSTDQPRRGERLGEIMIQHGSVKSDHFIAFIDAFRPELGRPLGIALVEDNVVTSEQLTEALTDQMQFHFDRVFEAESCSFIFYEDELSPSTGLSIGVSEFLIGTGRSPGEPEPTLSKASTEADSTSDSGAWTPGLGQDQWQVSDRSWKTPDARQDKD